MPWEQQLQEARADLAAAHEAGDARAFTRAQARLEVIEARRPEFDPRKHLRTPTGQFARKGTGALLRGEERKPIRHSSRIKWAAVQKANLANPRSPGYGRERNESIRDRAQLTRMEKFRAPAPRGAAAGKAHPVGHLRTVSEPSAKDREMKDWRSRRTDLSPAARRAFGLPPDDQHSPGYKEPRPGDRVKTDKGIGVVERTKGDGRVIVGYIDKPTSIHAPGTVEKVPARSKGGNYLDSSGQSESGKRTRANIAAGRSGQGTPLKQRSPGYGEVKDKGIDELAAIIRRDWKNVNFAAQPYLDAMTSLRTVDDKYGADSGRSIVAYFLSNASSWRGPTAKAVKAELRRRAKR